MGTEIVPINRPGSGQIEKHRGKQHLTPRKKPDFHLALSDIREITDVLKSKAKSRRDDTASITRRKEPKLPSRKKQKRLSIKPTPLEPVSLGKASGLSSRSGLGLTRREDIFTSREQKLPGRTPALKPVKLEQISLKPKGFEVQKAERNESLGRVELSRDSKDLTGFSISPRLESSSAIGLSGGESDRSSGIINVSQTRGVVYEPRALSGVKMREIQPNIGLKRGPDNSLEIKKVGGSNFERLVDTISENIDAVEEVDGQVQLTLKRDVIWHSGAKPLNLDNTNRDWAKHAIVARAAAFAAALKHGKDELDIETTVAIRELEVEASEITHPHPWYTNQNDPLSLAPIKLSEALGKNHQQLLKEAYPERPVRKRMLLAPSIAALSVGMTACALAKESPPAEVFTIEPSEEVTKAATPKPTKTTEPTSTQVVDVTPEAVFEEVKTGYIPVEFPKEGGTQWQYTDIYTVTTGGIVDTGNIKEQGFTPLAEKTLVTVQTQEGESIEEKDRVTILVEGENEVSFFRVPKLDKVQYRVGNAVKVAEFDRDQSSDFVYTYLDEGKVIYCQPGIVADFGDETIPIFGRNDVTGDVWVFYLDGNGNVVRKGQALFSGDTEVEVYDGKVLIDGQPKKVGKSASGEWVNDEWYRKTEIGKVEMFEGGGWKEVPSPEIDPGYEFEMAIESGHPVVKLDGEDFGLEEGLVVGEFGEGKWNPASFAVTKKADEVINDLDQLAMLASPQRLMGDNQGRVHYSDIEAKPIGFKMEVDTSGDIRMEALFAEKEGLYRTEIDLFLFSNDDTIATPTDDLSLGQIVKIIELFKFNLKYDYPILLGNDQARRVDIYPGFQSIRKDASVEEICSAMTMPMIIPGFREACWLIFEDDEIYRPENLEELSQLIVGSTVSPVGGSPESWWTEVPPVEPDLMSIVVISDEILEGGFD